MLVDNVSTTRRRMIASGAGMMAGAAIARPFAVAAQDATPAATPVTPPDMSGAAYSFTLGSFSGVALSDGAGAGASLVPILFGKTPDDALATVLDEAGLSPSEIVSQNTLTIFDTGKERVLVDTGTGPQSGLLFDNLEMAGIDRASIDVVLLTHAHGDHVGGNVDADGNAAFSNARYVMSQEEWDFWTDQQAVEEALPAGDFRDSQLQSVQNNLLPIEDRFDLIGYDEEVVPGIRSVAAQGHTPGHTAYRFESDGEFMWALGDAALHPLDLQHPEFAGVPDTNVEQMIETRMRLFAQIVDEGGLAYFKHFYPFPSIGLIAADGDVWSWEPLAGDDSATPVS